MSNWTNYRQKISPGFRNVVQALENYYTSQDSDFNTFNSKTVEDIENDLQGLSSDSLFYLEYANSILDVAKQIPLEFGTIEGITYSLLNRDQNHYSEIVSQLASDFTDFETLIAQTAQSVATSVYNAAVSTDFFDEIAGMLIDVKTVSIWEQFMLNADAAESKGAERLITLAQDPAEGNMNSFRLFESYSANELATFILSFTSGNNYFLGEVASIHNRAKVIYDQHGEEDPAADIWEYYFNSFADSKQEALNLIIETGAFATVYELANAQFSTLEALLDEEFFRHLAPFYKSNAAQIIENNTVQYEFTGRLLNTMNDAPIPDYLVQVFDKNDTEFGDRLVSSTATNQNGYFSVNLDVLTEITTPYQLDYEFKGGVYATQYELQRSFDPSAGDGVESFTISVNDTVQSAVISGIVLHDDNVVIPPELDTFLTNNNLTTLQNVRDFGGISSDPALPTGTETVAQRIDDHANLEVLFSDYEEEDFTYLGVARELIDNGFNNIPTIINTDRYDFIRKMRLDLATGFSLGQYDAGRIYEQADGIMSYITTQLNRGLVDGFKDFENDPDLQAALNDLKSNKCNCDDCKAGTSPLAYLTDLINYSIKNISEVVLGDDLIPGISVQIAADGTRNISLSTDPAVTAGLGPVVLGPTEALTRPIDTSTPLSLNDLEARFKHPFAQLPANCDSVSKKICQVRVCIEVLWTHMFDAVNNITTSNDLLSAEKLKEIRLATYEYLLSELGTSYDEIRKFRLSSPEGKAQLSARLGIKEENLEELNLPYSEENDTISDIKLEELFGYRDTTRNYKTTDVGEELPNALVDTPKSRVSIFKENFLRDQFHESDFPDLPYSAMGRAKIDPDIIFPGDFREPEESNPRFALWQKRFDWINNFTSVLKGLTRKVSTFPASKRVIASMSEAEAEQISTFTVTDQSNQQVALNVVDFSMNATGNQASFLVEQTPPTLLRTGTFLVANSTDFDLAGEEVVDITSDNSAEPEKKSLFERFFEGFNYTYTFINENEETIEETVLVKPWVHQFGENDEGKLDEGLVDVLFGNIKNREYYENSLAIIQLNYALNEEQFLRFYDLFDKDRKAGNDPNKPQLLPEEVEELIDLAVTSAKNRLTSDWINEEDSLVGGSFGIDTEFFWEAEKELVEGETVFPDYPGYFTAVNTLPLIDPDEISLKDLPDWKIGTTAVQLFNDRKASLETSKVAIRGERITYSELSDLGFSKVLDFVYGANILATFNSLANNLSSTDSTVAALAAHNIVEYLKLSVEEFSFVISLKEKCNEQDPMNQPSEEEWSQLYGTLLRPYKLLNLVDTWKGEEAVYYHTDPDPVKNECWKLRKPKLRKWRGGSAIRQAWVEELKRLKRQPIIDPYLITPANMKGLDADDAVFSSENRVFQIWDNRRDYLELKRETLITDLGTTEAFQHINTFLQDELKITADFEVNVDEWELISDDLSGLKQNQNDGFSIKKALNQLGFTRKSFEYLFEIRDLLKLDGSILLTPPEREEIANLLIDILKRRYFTLWNLEEQYDIALQATYPFALSPDFFMMPPAQEFSFPPLKKKEKPQYLFNSKEYKKWQRTLESKERVWKNNADSLERMLSATEDRFLIPTRDAIVAHMAEADNLSLEETHDFITRSLLIDSKTTSCMPTTRVSQAIEALQILLWGMHNQVLIDEPNITQLTLTAPDFEEEWKWLGSYATWRAAMFVQLYPENILLPSLKLNQSEPYRKAIKQLNQVTSVETAQQVFYNYFEYLEDVKTMELLGTCRISGSSGIITSLGENDLDLYERSYFNFGKGGKTGKFYFRETHITDVDGSITRMSQWKEIPIDTRGTFVGVDVVQFDGENSIYLFIQEETKLLFTAYDFRKNTWGEYTNVEFETDTQGVSLNMDLQYMKYFITSDGVKTRPMIFVHGYNRALSSDVYEGQPAGAKVDLLFEMFWMHKDQKARHYMHNDNRFNVSDFSVNDRVYLNDFYAFEPVHVYFDNKYIDKKRWEYLPGVTSDPFYLDETGQNQSDFAALVVVCKHTLANSCNHIVIPFTWKKYGIRHFTLNLLGCNKFIRKLPFSASGSMRNSFWHTTENINEGKLRISGFSEVVNESEDNNDNLYTITSNVDQVSSNFYATNFDFGQKLTIFMKSEEKERVNQYDLELIDGKNTLTLKNSTDITFLPETEVYDLTDEKVNIHEIKLNEFYQGLVSENSGSVRKSQLVNEAFYYLPLALANKLTALGQFEEAKKYFDVIFDFKTNQPYAALLSENTSNAAIEINDEWGDNPLNPHMIAATRPNALRQSFYLQLINYFISYANHEFTQDNVESIARAKQLYLEAEELLEQIKPEQLNEETCEGLIATYQLDIDSIYMQEYWERLITRIVKIESQAQLDAFLQTVQTIWDTVESEKYRMEQIEIELQDVLNSVQSASVTEQIDANGNKYISASNLLANALAKKKVTGSLAQRAATRFDTAIQQATGFNAVALKTAPIDVPFLETPGALVPIQDQNFPGHSDWYQIDLVNGGSANSRGERAIKKPEEVFRTSLNKKALSFFRPSFEFCIAPNPVYKAFDLSIQLNLYKIRNSMNISGIQRSLEPFAAPTDATTGIPMIGADGLISTGGLPIPQASAYRYDFLINRAKELIGMSQNVEGSFLAALEKLDDEKYSVLKATQDQEVAKANIKLQDLKIDEAETGIESAALQTERAVVQVDGLQEMIDEGLIQSEVTLVNLYSQFSRVERQMNTINALANSYLAVANAVSAGGGGTTFASVAAALAATAPAIIAINTGAVYANELSKIQKGIQITGLISSYERRVQEWNYQMSIANHDIKIGQVGEKLAQDRLRIVTQEKAIAELQLQHSDATINYLKNEQFTNAALYEFMIEVLEKVYSYFLREATAAAKLASQQLAFERQKQLPEFIKGDYWIPETDTPSAGAEEEADRKGLTGSTRLLQDINRLDQYAISTDERRQRVTKTISLASIAPFEFQQFRESGILTFATDMQLFDQDHPGHYMRLIKRVSTNVVALAPPVDGIKASLSSVGLSRVVTGGPLYQTQDIRRSPETVTLSAPNGNNGIFELAQDEKFLRPFEGNGVEGFWEFRMEKAANPNLNYNAVADVLITIEYEALNSFDYRAQVVRRLNSNNEYEAMLPISFKSNLPDQWFDISNPDQATTPFEVSFELSEDNFPANVKDPVITNVMLYFPQEGEEDEEIGMVNFEYTVKGSESKIGGYNLNTLDAKISTADANGTALNGILGKSVAGKWELKLQDNANLRGLIAEDKLSDILMVLTFAGETPKYNL